MRAMQLSDKKNAQNRKNRANKKKVGSATKSDGKSTPAKTPDSGFTNPEDESDCDADEDNYDGHSDYDSEAEKK